MKLKRICSLVLVAVAVLACRPESRLAEETKRAEAIPMPSPELLADYEKLRSLYDSIPPDFRDAKLSIEEIARRVEEARALGERIVRDATRGPHRRHAEFMLASLIFISFDRLVLGGEASGIDLANRALSLLESSSAAPPGAAPDPMADAGRLALRGNLYRKRANYQKSPDAWRKDFLDQRAAHLELLEKNPKWPDRAILHAQIAETFLHAGDPAGARKYIEKVLAEDPTLRWNPTLLEKLFDACLGVGDLDAAEDLVHQRMLEFPKRIALPETPRWERDTMTRWLDLAEFWLGHVLMARGRSEEAEAAFREHVRRLDEKEVLLDAKGEKLDSIVTIFRDHRSRDSLEYLEKFHGTRPTQDFDFKDLWCSERRPTLAASRGKVVAALFRNPGDPRSAPFVRALGDLAEKESARGLAALVAGLLDPSEPAGQQLAAMCEDLKALKVDLPAGYDPDGKGHKIFVAMHANVGSPSFVLFDREGKMAWYLLDPRAVDVGVLKAVVLRVLGDR